MQSSHCLYVHVMTEPVNWNPVKGTFDIRTVSNLKGSCKSYLGKNNIMNFISSFLSYKLCSL